MHIFGIRKGNHMTWHDFMKSTWSQNFVKFTAFSHVIQFRALAWRPYDQDPTNCFYWAWHLLQAPWKSSWRLVSIPDGNFEKTAIRPGAIQTGIGPHKWNSQFQSLDMSLPLDVMPNLKWTSIEAWASSKVVRILWCVVGGPRFKPGGM